MWKKIRRIARHNCKKRNLGFVVLIIGLCLICIVAEGADQRLNAVSQNGQKSTVAITGWNSSQVAVDVTNCERGLLFFLLYDKEAHVLDTQARFVTKETDVLLFEIEPPVLPDEYTVKAILLGFGADYQKVECSQTAVLYSDFYSTSRVSGVFTVPGLSEKATKKEWQLALQNMKEIGIDTVIIQYSYQRDPLYGDKVYFPFYGVDTASDAQEYPLRRDQIEHILAAAQKNGMKVYLGLQLAEREWFDEDQYQNEAWLTEQCRFSLELADSLWDHFGKAYADTIAGWYLPFEFESSEEYYGYFPRMTECYYVPLTEALKSSLQFGNLEIMISPLQYGQDDKAAWQENLETVLSGAQIDIIAPQDGIGYGTQDHSTVSKWFKATKEAVEMVNRKYSKSIRLWGNCENYMRLRNPDEPDSVARRKPMNIAKFIKSLDMAAPYAEKLITFSLHRWDTVLDCGSAEGLNQSYYEAYKRYFFSGEKPKSKSEGYYVSISPLDNDDELHFHPDANAGLSDGFASDLSACSEYKGIGTEDGGAFVLEMRFDDPTEIKKVSSHYYEDSSAAIALPLEIRYEYLIRFGDYDEVFTYETFYVDTPFGDGAVVSTAVLDMPVVADGVRITVKSGAEWTFIDDIFIE